MAPGADHDAEKDLLPDEHLFDSAYIDAPLLAQSQTDHDVTLVGPVRDNPSWQSRLEGGYDSTKFTLDWETKQALCPQGKSSSSWCERCDKRRVPATFIKFKKSDCADCEARALCTRASHEGRALQLPAREHYEAQQAARQLMNSKDGKELYKKRTGIEGTLSQGVRAFGLRQARYRSLAKTHLQSLATAAAINLDRIVAWLDGKPAEGTRTSRFAALAA